LSVLNAVVCLTVHHQSTTHAANTNKKDRCTKMARKHEGERENEEKFKKK
jgi:hypothetical protein